MTSPKETDDELAGTEQPFVQHLMELRDRLLYAMVGLGACMALLAIWPGPSGLIDLIAVPIRAHMPPDAKLIAVGVFSPFFVPLKVLAMAPWTGIGLGAFRYVSPMLEPSYTPDTISFNVLIKTSIFSSLSLILFPVL